MALPQSREARLFYRCAFQRFEDAEILRVRGDRTTGAVYLAGYAIECILKALVLSVVAPTGRTAMLQTFRGAKGHDFDWLRNQYFQGGGARFPRDVNDAFVFVRSWSTDLRYEPGEYGTDEADDFLSAARRLLRWADGRL